ncbi:LacI family transcriptional regulator [bacterium]|nr:MAG: LacI family transcriptional regulator [bacterium]
MPRESPSPNKPARIKRVTLRDIAKVAGVHVMTVSDALNGTRSVAPATREKVKRIAQELNYVPHFAARALATGRTGIVAVFTGAMNSPYHANMVHSLEKPMVASGYQLLLLRNKDEVKHMLEAKGNTTVDGAISIGMYHLLEQFGAHAKVPLISVGSWPYEFVDNVIVDMTAGVDRALQLMVDGGGQRIGYLTTSATGKSVEVRVKVYNNFMHRSGLKPEIINLHTIHLGDIPTLLRKYIQGNGLPDGLFCHNDEMAMAAYRAIREEGYRVPDDVMMVGCDGLPYMDYFDTPLSTITQPMEEMGAATWQIFLDRLGNPDLPLQNVTLNGELIVRRSLIQTA